MRDSFSQPQLVQFIGTFKGPESELKAAQKPVTEFFNEDGPDTTNAFVVQS